MTPNMAATFSNALIVFVYFYLYYIYDDAFHFPMGSDALSFSNHRTHEAPCKVKQFQDHYWIQAGWLQQTSNIVSVWIRSN